MSKILKGIKLIEAAGRESDANYHMFTRALGKQDPTKPTEFHLQDGTGKFIKHGPYATKAEADVAKQQLANKYFGLTIVPMSKMDEGGNVFKGKTSPIKIEDIDPTLLAYFAELKTIFPKKADIFDEEHFHALGSVRKKAQSGDIDLGISVAYILDKTMSDESIAMWGVDPAAVAKQSTELQKRARSSTPEQSRLKAFLQLLVLYINSVAPNLYCDEKKVTDGNIFGFFPQFNAEGEKLGTGVQIDWMIGNIDWLKFSYYSAAYPKGSNVKGLHRTQLMLSAFQVAGLSFNHVTGVKDKATGEIIDNPENALSGLGKRLGFTITKADAEDYYRLQKLFKTKMSSKDYSTLLDIYFKILDSTRADIPDNLQSEWLKRKDSLGLKGAFLPDDSKLKSYISESGVAGADRVKSRQDFQQFLKSYKGLISQFPGFVSLDPSGSYNSNLEKNDFGDIDLIVHIQSDQDKATVKKQLQAFFMKQPETVIVPFSSAKHVGKRSYNAGELVSVRYHDDHLDYSAQIDNIVALDQKETEFKQQFLDWPAEKQGLILGLVKIAAIETKPSQLFKQLGIKNPGPLDANQEYEFNLSSSGLQLRKVTYEPGTYKESNREVLWKSQNWEDVQKLLYQYDLNAKFDDLLEQTKRTIRNPRSSERMKGVFSSMITVKSGEVGTPKGAGKEAALAKIQQQFSESRSIFKALVEINDKKVGKASNMNEGTDTNKKYTIKKSSIESRFGEEKAVWNIMYGDEVIDTTFRRSDAKFYADKWNAAEKKSSNASQKTGKSDVAEGINISNELKNIRSKSTKELDNLILFYTKALEFNPKFQQNRELLDLVKMVRQERKRMNKQGMAESSEEKEKCKYCAGTGWVLGDGDGSMEQLCTACDGTGDEDEEAIIYKEGSVTSNFKIGPKSEYDKGKADSYYRRGDRSDQSSDPKEYLRGYDGNDDHKDWGRDDPVDEGTSNILKGISRMVKGKPTPGAEHQKYFDAYKKAMQTGDKTEIANATRDLNRIEKVAGPAFFEGLGLPFPGTYEQERGLESTDEKLDEKWSDKYKRSIDCSHPKGFSQRAHFQGKKKK